MALVQGAGWSLLRGREIERCAGVAILQTQIIPLGTDISIVNLLKYWTVRNVLSFEKEKKAYLLSLQMRRIPRGSVLEGSA